MRINRKRAWTWIKYILIIYVLAGIALYYLQEKLIFHPWKLEAGYQFDIAQPYKEVNLAVNESKNVNILQFTVADSLRRGVVLYFHGNKGNNERFAPFAKDFTKHGFEVWMIDYPGFGKSTGDRSEKILYEDARLLYTLAASKFSKDSIIIYGKSIGTGPAAYLASVRDCRHLVLESPFENLPALMNRYAFIYPVSIMAKYRFPTDHHLDLVRAPITIFHGTRDRLIPFRHSQQLKKKFPHINLIRIEGGGHNDLNQFPEYNLEAVLD